MHDKYMGEIILREVKVLMKKYYRDPYIYSSNSADKETYRLTIGTAINKHEILRNTGCKSIDRSKRN